MTSLHQRAYAGGSDLDPIVSLINSAEAIDPLDTSSSQQRLSYAFSSPRLDLAQDLQLWQDPNGRLVGFAWLRQPDLGGEDERNLRFYVHPQQVLEDLLPPIFGWAEKRTRQIASQTGSSGKLRIATSDSQPEWMKRLGSWGFEMYRSFLVMETAAFARSYPLPAGFALKLFSENDIDRWVELFNASFIDHWNHHDIDRNIARHWLQDPDYHPNLHLIAIAPAGKQAGFCLIHKQGSEASIHFLGTHRNYRRMGLGRALLRAGLDALYRAGSTSITLEADAAGSAVSLYVSEGFRPIKTLLLYKKDL